MKRLKKFLEELDIEDLSGIPGQGRRKPNEPDYLRDVESRAKQRLGIGGVRRNDPRAIQAALGLMGRASNELQQMSVGHERQLEQLAEKIIYQYYKEIIDYFGIKLDLKIVTYGQMSREARQTALKDPSLVKKYDPVKDKNKKPVVKARAVDFSLLLHETVKGIYIVLYRQAVPVDPKLAKKIRDMFTLADEPSEWTYGPEIAADLRDFVNENELVDKYPNLREFLFYDMCHKLNGEEFVSLMRGILAKTPEARQKVDNMLANLYKKFYDWKDYQRRLEEYNRQMAQYEKDMAEWEKKYGQTPEPTFTQREEEDIYMDMTKRELEAAIDRALDNGDFELVKKLVDVKEKKFGE